MPWSEPHYHKMARSMDDSSTTMSDSPSIDEPYFPNTSEPTPPPTPPLRTVAPPMRHHRHRYVARRPDAPLTDDANQQQQQLRQMTDDTTPLVSPESGARVVAPRVIENRPVGEKLAHGTGSFFRGMWDHIRDTGVAIKTAITQPVETLKKLGHMVVHPIESMRNVKDYFMKPCEGDRARCAGSMAGFLATAGLTEGAGVALSVAGVATKTIVAAELGVGAAGTVDVVDRSNEVAQQRAADDERTLLRQPDNPQVKRTVQAALRQYEALYQRK